MVLSEESTRSTQQPPAREAGLPARAWNSHDLRERWGHACFFFEVDVLKPCCQLAFDTSLTQEAQLCLCRPSRVPELSLLPATCPGREAEREEMGGVKAHVQITAEGRQKALSLLPPSTTMKLLRQLKRRGAGKSLWSAKGTKQSPRLERFLFTISSPVRVAKRGFWDCPPQQPHPSVCRYQPNTLSVSSSTYSRTPPALQATNRSALPQKCRFDSQIIYVTYIQTF